MDPFVVDAILASSALVRGERFTPALLERMAADASAGRTVFAGPDEVHSGTGPAMTRAARLVEHDGAVYLLAEVVMGDGYEDGRALIQRIEGGTARHLAVMVRADAYEVSPYDGSATYIEHDLQPDDPSAGLIAVYFSGTPAHGHVLAPGDDLQVPKHAQHAPAPRPRSWADFVIPRG